MRFILTMLISAASPSATAPTQVLRAADVEVQSLLRRGDGTVEALGRRADAYVDFDELSKRSMGELWPKLAPAQRADFSATMKGLLRASYAQKALSDGRAGANVEYGAETVTGDDATVATVIHSGDDRIPVVYRMHRSGRAARWRICDVVTDEVSLVDTYADQFRQVVAKRGIDGLLASLKAKRQQLEASDAGSSAAAVAR